MTHVLTILGYWLLVSLVVGPVVGCVIRRMGED